MTLETQLTDLLQQIIRQHGSGGLVVSQVVICEVLPDESDRLKLVTLSVPSTTPYWRVRGVLEAALTQIDVARWEPSAEEGEEPA